MYKLLWKRHRERYGGLDPADGIYKQVDEANLELVLRDKCQTKASKAGLE
jgi:hypothetical protein